MTRHNRHTTLLRKDPGIMTAQEIEEIRAAVEELAALRVRLLSNGQNTAAADLERQINRLKTAIGD